MFSKCYILYLFEKKNLEYLGMDLMYADNIVIPCRDGILEREHNLKLFDDDLTKVLKE